jgi:hypothetical protein
MKNKEIDLTRLFLLIIKQENCEIREKESK